jgi:protein-tyrosine phosphatase
VVATPHIYPGVFDNTLETIATAHATLDTALAQQQIPLTLSLGAEVRLCAEMLDWLAQGRLPFLGGQGGTEPVVLVELPDAQIPLGADRVLGALIDRGVTPLLAHPERNRAIAEQVSRLAPLVRLGCKLQVTAASLLGEFGSRAEKAAQELLDAGWVEVVASDAHNLTGRRPRLGAARDWLTQRYGQALAEALTEHNPARLARQGELAMQGIDGLTLRDLPRGHGGPAAAQAGPSLIDMLLELPSSAAAPLRSAAEPTRGAAAAKVPRDPLHGEWSLTDFTLEAQTQAQAQARTPTRRCRRTRTLRNGRCP